MLANKQIVIKDANFNHIKGCNQGCVNLFITDAHDLETMTITPEVEKFITLEILEHEETGLFQKVMSDIKVLSYMRLYNDLQLIPQRKGILFEGIKVSSLYDGNNPITIDNCVNLVRNHGNNNAIDGFPWVDDMTDFVAKHSNEDIFQLSRGHDVVHGVVCRMKALLGKNPSNWG